MKKFIVKNWRKLAIVGVVVLLIVFRTVSNKTKEVKYDTSTVVKGELIETLSTTGQVKADQHATLTFQGGGRLAWVNVKKGDRVKKGQAVAGLDTLILNSAYQQALNNYRNYEAAAQSALDSVKDHSGNETFAQKATRTAAEVARDNAYDAVRAAEQNLKFASIYSPFSGVVVEANPSFAGANVTSATSSYVIVNPDTVYFESEISETDLPKVKTGQLVRIRLDAYPEETIEGAIEDVGVVAFISSTGGNSYSLRVAMPKNVDFKYKIGMEGDMDIVTKTLKDVVKVPTTSLVNEDEKDYVWIHKDGKVTKREVKIGSNSDDETEILSGISENELVISEPSNKFKDGQKVKI